MKKVYMKLKFQFNKKIKINKIIKNYKNCNNKIKKIIKK